MQRLLCTIGFTGKTAEEFFTLLSNAGVQQVVDIRQNRSGQLSGFSKHPDLCFFLKKIAGIEYLHEPLLAPPHGKSWQVIWSSEDPKYDGSGFVHPDSPDNWRLQAESAFVLSPTREEPEARPGI